ncbi:alpha/beta hydrolase family protein [Variovorax sp. GT1P44]|uniref:alpha/beta hydrolase family protein n=1 Tax=Variovorax sp. GT1P44 TaxID=3443742 RepID=UPI003F462E97
MQKVSIPINDALSVSGIVQAPSDPVACYVFAHGAGAGMEHSFMAAVADGLAERRIATLRYQFPYMELGKKRTDTPPVAHAAVRAAVAHAAQTFGSLRLVAGGKSFGARMTSQAQAIEPLPGVEGLVFIGFPLHPADAPAVSRAEHLSKVLIPMLFVQGTQDKLAEPGHLRPFIDALGARATLMTIEHADHSFHVLKRTGRNDDEVLKEILDGVAQWVAAL